MHRRNSSGFRADSPHSVTACVAVDLALMFGTVAVMAIIQYLTGIVP